MTAPFTGGGALAGTLSRATSPAVARLLSALGSDCTIRRFTEVRQADNSMTRTWADVALAQRIVVSQVTAARAAREWGAEKRVTAEGMCAIVIDIGVGDGIIITAGPYTGDRYKVVASRPDPVGGIRALAFESTRETFA